jgi:Zn finger protein HypA/HybF involved in hydrogenase expression
MKPVKLRTRLRDLMPAKTRCSECHKELVGMYPDGFAYMCGNCATRMFKVTQNKP